MKVCRKSTGCLPELPELCIQVSLTLVCLLLFYWLSPGTGGLLLSQKWAKVWQLDWTPIFEKYTPRFVAKNGRPKKKHFTNKNELCAQKTNTILGSITNKNLTSPTLGFNP